MKRIPLLTTTIPGLMLVLCLLWLQPHKAYAVGLYDEFTYLQESWFLDRYKESNQSRPYVIGYSLKGILDDNLLPDPSAFYRPNARTLLFSEYFNESDPSKARKLLSQITSDSGSILAMAVGTIAFLYVMPESFSKWPEEKKDLSPNKLWERYDDSIKNGPVWDKDEWEVNYIGHPYFGAAYYTHAMNKNFTRLESLSYSFMMSTCLYEYGLEAFFEDPSIQDIIITPVVGSLFGEVFISLSDAIESNGKMILGSRALGHVCLFMLDPISATLRPINAFNEKYSKLRMEAHYYSRSAVSDNVVGPGTFYDHRVGVEISISTDAFFY